MYEIIFTALSLLWFQMRKKINQRTSITRCGQLAVPIIDMLSIVLLGALTQGYFEETTTK